MEILKLVKKLILLWGPPVLWAALIFTLSSQRGLSIGEGAVDFWTRKPAHIGEYVVLFGLLFRALKGSLGSRWRVWEIYTGAGILTLVYALTDELHQLFVPTRAGKITDLGFDLLGIIVGIVLINFIQRKRSDSA